MWFKKQIEQAEENADKAWKEAAHRRVRYLAKNKRHFTSEDVITWLDKRGYKTKDNRALGAIMQHYQKEGWIKAHGWTEASRKTRHHAPVRVWHSLVRRYL